MGVSLLACLVLAIASPGSRGEEGDVAIGGEILFTIKSAAGGKSIAQRVDAVTERLPEIVNDPHIRPEDVRVIPLKDKTVKIMIKTRLLVTVMPEDGKVNKKSVLDQARAWAAQIRIVLPKINAKPNPAGP